jgi:hypothetical protein
VVACKTYAMGFINIKSGTSCLMSKTIAKLILNVPNDVPSGESRIELVGVPGLNLLY